jgi:hypothetical protein
MSASATGEIVKASRITCPHCGRVSAEAMPEDACQYFYDCKGCGAVLKPLAGDCCVFCSFGDVKCPPVQSAVCCG